MTSRAGFFLVGLIRCFSNSNKPLRALIRRVLKGSRQSTERPPRSPILDQRGRVAEKSPIVQTRLNAQNRTRLLAEYADGAPVNELARRYSIHRATVHGMARRAGLPPRNGPELPQQVREDAAALYAGGLSLLKVARRLGISDDAVRDAVVACGGTIRPRGRHIVLA